MTKAVVADSLGCRRVGEHGFELAQSFVEQSLVVTEGAVRRAQGLPWDELRIVAEPGGAVALGWRLSRGCLTKQVGTAASIGGEVVHARDDEA